MTLLLTSWQRKENILIQNQANEFFIWKRMTQELGSFKCFSVLAIFGYLSLLFIFFKWNLRCVTLLWWRNKNRLFHYILISGIVFFSYFYKFKCMRREQNASSLLLWMPSVVEGDYEVSFSPKWHSALFLYYNQLYGKQFKSFFLYMSKIFSTRF